jgi:hypothetical protein
MEDAQLLSQFNLLPEDRRRQLLLQLQLQLQLELPGADGPGPMPAVSGPAMSTMASLGAPSAICDVVTVMPGAADLNAAVYRTAINTAAELLENALGAGALNFQLYILPVNDKKVRRADSALAAAPARWQRAPVRRRRLRRRGACRLWCLQTTGAA